MFVAPPRGPAIHTVDQAPLLNISVHPAKKNARRTQLREGWNDDAFSKKGQRTETDRDRVLEDPLFLVVVGSRPGRSHTGMPFSFWSSPLGEHRSTIGWSGEDWGGPRSAWRSRREGGRIDQVKDLPVSFVHAWNRRR